MQYSNIKIQRKNGEHRPLGKSSMAKENTRARQPMDRQHVIWDWIDRNAHMHMMFCDVNNETASYFRFQSHHVAVTDYVHVRCPSTCTCDRKAHAASQGDLHLANSTVERISYFSIERLRKSAN